MTDHVTTGALAGAVRALRSATTGADVARIQARLRKETDDAAVHAVVDDVATLALDRITAFDDARRDVLTGALNRRGFFDAAHGRLAACPGPVAVVVVDVDGLKTVNDRHGHAVGSRLLRSAADALAAAFPSAVVGRIGGDEFAALVLDRTDLPALDRRLQTAVRARRPDAARLSLSAGWATGIATGPTDLGALLERADAELYRRRGERRRRVTHPRFVRGAATPAVREPVAG